MSGPWTRWLEQCSLSGLHAFARGARVRPRAEEDETLFRARMVELSKAGKFDELYTDEGKQPDAT